MLKNHKYKMLYAIILISLLASVFAVKFPPITNISSISLYFSAIAGYSGMMLLLWSFIMGTRSVITLFFDDFARNIKIHSCISKYGTLLIFVHPILVTLSYGESLLYSILPDFSTHFNNAVTYGRTALWITLVVWLSSAILKSKMSFRPWKYIHLAAYLAVPFALLHVPTSGTNYANLMSARIYFFVTVIGFILFAILRLRGALNLNKSRYTLIDQKQITDHVYEISLKPINTNKIIHPLPGQYIYIKLGFFGSDHPFSIMNYDKADGTITIGYKVFGKFTDKLSGIRTGEKLFVSGPFGRFMDKMKNEKTIYIAGGIGVTPFISRIFNESNQREQWLFYSNQTPDSAAFLQPLANMMGNKLIPIFSQARNYEFQNKEFGHINAAIISKYINNPKEYSYYICGPQSLIDSISKDLRSLGVDNKKINYESFNF